MKCRNVWKEGKIRGWLLGILWKGQVYEYRLCTTSKCLTFVAWSCKQACIPARCLPPSHGAYSCEVGWGSVFSGCGAKYVAQVDMYWRGGGGLCLSKRYPPCPMFNRQMHVKTWSWLRSISAPKWERTSMESVFKTSHLQRLHCNMICCCVLF